MTTQTYRATSRPAPPGRGAALLLLLQFAGMWGAFLILAPAIDWPASLDAPPDEILPLILAQAGPVFAGYLAYLVHAVLLIPIAVLLWQPLRMTPVLATLCVTLGTLAGFAKALGIVRWLFLMPSLAAAHADPTTSGATRDAIAVVYRAFNAYAGGIGELLGVGLFAGGWTVVLSVALLRLGGWARPLGWAGLACAALLLATLLSLVGIENPVLLTLSGVLWQLWTAALALWLLRATLQTGDRT